LTSSSPSSDRMTVGSATSRSWWDHFGEQSSYDINLADWWWDVKAVKVCILHLGRAQRVGNEESQDVDRPSADEGYHPGRWPHLTIGNTSRVF
jgi:hypothetical protein